MASTSISVFVSCYNEQTSIVPTIESAVRALSQSGLSWEIIVTDDVSSDNSVQVIRDYLRGHSELPIRFCVHETNQGLIRSIFEAVHLAQGQYFWMIAGDNNVDDATARELLSHVGTVDIVIPHVLRYSGRALHRRIISKAYAFIVRFLSGCPVRYYNGASIHRRTHLLWLEDNIKSFAFGANCIIRLLDHGFSYVEVPVVYNERTSGKSTALTLKNLRDVTAFFVTLVARRVKRSFQSDEILQPDKIIVERDELG
jgi:glycosyltransferase involved in cell wall biosynthesis